MKRTALLRRTPLRSKRPEPRPAKQVEYTPRPRTCVVSVADDRARLVVPVPKEEKAKPGKRAPTVEEKAWMDTITALGCIACLIDGHPGTPGAVHHLLRGGQRIGHLHTICLCDPGHHQNGGPLKVSRHPHKTRCQAKYGTAAELLARTKTLVGAAT